MFKYNCEIAKLLISENVFSISLRCKSFLAIFVVAVVVAVVVVVVVVVTSNGNHDDRV